tara:strand:- start:265 stop:501 length:237 start_codon:yes stop_codon:yes gene_type:complete
MKKILFVLFCCVALVGYGQESKCLSGNCENGQGAYISHNGNKYLGEFKDGIMHGKGTLYNPDGSIYHSGLWKDGEPVK